MNRNEYLKAIRDGLAVKLIIRGKPLSWKNSRQIIFKRDNGGQRAAAVKNAAQKRWFESAITQLRAQWIGEDPIPESERLNVSIVSYLATRRLIDADNLYGGPHDALQESGVIENDSSIQTHDGSDRLYDKEDPRVEITIMRYNPSDKRRASPIRGEAF